MTMKKPLVVGPEEVVYADRISEEYENPAICIKTF